MGLKSLGPRLRVENDAPSTASSEGRAGRSPMLPRSSHSRTSLHSEKSVPRAHPDHEQQPGSDLAPASHRQRTRLLRELRQAGLGDSEARAEASRLLGGDIWCG